ncbi:MAG: zinc ribbon domain-containing protein [Anaerolineae bacterium]
MPTDLINTLMVALQVFLALLGGFLAAFHISLVIWTFRDIRSRSRDAFAHILAAALVLFFSLPGLLLYLILRPRETLAEQYERALEEEALLQDIEERLVCPGCQRKVEPDFMVCPACHTQLKVRCRHCGRLLHPKWTLCPYCASPVGPPPPETLTKAGALEAAPVGGPAVAAAGADPESPSPQALSPAEGDEAAPDTLEPGPLEPEV